MTTIDAKDLQLGALIHEAEAAHFIQDAKLSPATDVVVKWYLKESPEATGFQQPEVTDRALLPLLSGNDYFPKYLGSCSTAFANGYVMNKYLCGSVHSVEAWTLSAVKRMVTQVLRALDHMHGLKWAHGDIKLENVLCDHLDPCAPNANFALTDFGWSFPLPWNGDRTKLGGTDGFMAPELLIWLGEVESSTAKPALPDGRIDIWSLGATLEMMLDEHRITNLHSDKKIREFIARCKVEDAGSRPTAAVLLKDSWLSK